MTSSKTPREGLPGTAFHQLYMERMGQIADIPVKHALRLNLAYKCPICRVLHPGIRYNQEYSRDFCSTACYARRREIQ